MYLVELTGPSIESSIALAAINDPVTIRGLFPARNSQLS